MKAISRRALMIGGAAIGLIGAAGIFALRLARDAGQLLATAEADYLAGRVVDRYGWIMSETEAARVPDIAGAHEKASSSASTAKS